LSVEFPWGRVSDPRGGSPRALGGVFDSFEGYVTLSDRSALDVRHGRGARDFDWLVSRWGDNLNTLVLTTAMRPDVTAKRYSHRT